VGGAVSEAVGDALGVGESEGEGEGMGPTVSVSTAGRASEPFVALAPTTT